MLTADYGGTGGKPIESGLVVEEPDIEIGAGVSSKGEHTHIMIIDHEVLTSSKPSAAAWRPTGVVNRVLGPLVTLQPAQLLFHGIANRNGTIGMLVILAYLQLYRALGFNSLACLMGSPCFRLALCFRVLPPHSLRRLVLIRMFLGVDAVCNRQTFTSQKSYGYILSRS